MEWISKIPDLLKVEARYVAIPLIVSACILFLPEYVLRWLRLETIAEKYGFIVGLIFLVTLALFLVKVFPQISNLIKNRREQRKFDERMKSIADNLDPEEKAVLREFHIVTRNVLNLPIDNPIVTGLLEKRILRIVGRQGRRFRVGNLFPVCMNEVAEQAIVIEDVFPSNYLTVTEDGQPNLSTEGKEWVLNNRPSFVDDFGTFGPMY